MALKIYDDYRFDNFFPCPQREEAYRTMLDAAYSNDLYANPIVLYGKSGGGLTHLIHGYANHIKEANPEATVKVFSAASCTKDLEDGYQGCDVLLLEELSFHSGYQQAQGKFAKIFEAFLSAGKQVIVSMAESPFAGGGFSQEILCIFHLRPSESTLTS